MIEQTFSSFPTIRSSLIEQNLLPLPFPVPRIVPFSLFSFYRCSFFPFLFVPIVPSSFLASTSVSFQEEV
jgi:hypothetical protein